MIQKKICLLGGFGVGKTSLVSRYVHSMFSDKYLTTVGVKIDKKSVQVDGTDVDLVIWDIYGQDDYQKVRMSYLRGAAGYLLVVDGTRRSTLDTALALHDSAQATVPGASFTLVINKADLAYQFEVTDDLLDVLVARGWRVLKTSAKTGDDVDAAFVTLARAMIQGEGQ
ncbi:MAG TPA: Rab family GTPase [Vicinamibacterales bacterium]|nr:Rab family GTPase [Vicinamibacterales bacterium]